MIVQSDAVDVHEKLLREMLLSSKRFEHCWLGTSTVGHGPYCGAPAAVIPKRQPLVAGQNTVVAGSPVRGCPSPYTTAQPAAVVHVNSPLNVGEHGAMSTMGRVDAGGLITPDGTAYPRTHAPGGLPIGCEGGHPTSTAASAEGTTRDRPVCVRTARAYRPIGDGALIVKFAIDQCAP